MIRGKVNWFSAKDINRIAPDIDTSNFTDINPYYDACEEIMMAEGFEMWDDDISEEGEQLIRGVWNKRYNIAVIKGVKRKDKFIVNEVGIAYKHIHNNKMNDLEKLTRAVNHLFPNKVAGKYEDDGIEAKKLLSQVIDKMKSSRQKNVK